MIPTEQRVHGHKIERERLPLERERLVERERIEFVPQWEGPIEGFTVKYCDRHQWRVMPELDFDDLYQEAFMLFLRMVERYPHVVEAKHFMSLYKTALHNMVTNLATHRTRRQRHETIAVLGHQPDEDRVRAAARNQGTGTNQQLAEVELEMALLEAPDVVKRLVQALEDCEGDELPSYERPGGVRETTNEWLARVTGLPAAGNLAATLKSWLSGEPCAA